MKSGFPIIAVDLFDDKLQLAKKMGATHTINSSRVDVKESLRGILQNQDLDIFVDNTGLPRIIELGYELTNSKGRIILVGVPKQGNNINLFSLPLHFGKTIVGSHGGESFPSDDILRYLNLINKKNINMDQIITNRFQLPEINKAIEIIKNGSASGRVIISL